jgi:SAM-dependent methyltransferase
VPSELPFPPLALADRVGSLASADDPIAAFELIGFATRQQIERMLPGDYSLAGRRALDFGCGAGRTLRHFVDEAESAEIWGADIDAPSVDWLRANLCPPLHAIRNGPAPPLPFAERSFDLVWALSVFTHLTDHWADWLVELHRILADDGFLIATILGDSHSRAFAGEPLDEGRVGMRVLRPHAGWDEGGPIVLHSERWIREHWGRAFEVLDLEHPPFELAISDQRWLLLRKRLGALTADHLRRPAT